MYRLLLVDTNEDLIIITDASCLRCLQIKKSLTVLKDFGVIDDAKNYVKLGVKIYNIKCECK